MPHVRRTAPAAALLLLGCAAYFPVNSPLERWRPDAGYRLGQAARGERSGELLLVLAFSGGGLRAAALSYGVLQELAETRVQVRGRSRRLVDEVDLISAVSGGSFTAAYYALYGDRIFRDYEARFLRRNVELAMLGQLFRPGNWPRLLSSYFSRSELAAEYYDDQLFEGATFGDLAAREGPAILINATDVSKGARFGFVQDQFDLICSDLSSFPISRAVAASSAVPVLLSPVILRNRAGGCGFEAPRWIDETLAGRRGSTRRLARARILKSYLDSGRRRFVHLIDGSISDNLGVRPLIDAMLPDGTGRETLEASGHGAARNLAVIVVNAEKRPDERWDRADIAPPLAVLLDAVTSVQINRFSFETLELVRAAFEQRARESAGRGRPVAFQLVEVGFESERDEAEYHYLNGLPTGLALSDESVDRLVAAGRRLLRQSPAFRDLLAALARDAAAYAESP